MSIETLIDRMAEEAMKEIRKMTDAAMLAAGFTQSYVNRSRAQRARFERQRRIKQGVHQ